MKVCLCGSTRFMDQFHAANVALSLAGHVVYSVATSVKEDFIPNSDEKMLLDLVHLRKIEESDVVMVVGKQPDGSTYIGESTRREIAWAKILEKQVLYYQPGVEMHGVHHELRMELTEAATTTAQREERARQEEARQQRIAESIFGSSSDSEDDESEEQPVSSTN
jgi:hypothetical protein